LQIFLKTFDIFERTFLIQDDVSAAQVRRRGKPTSQFPKFDPVRMNILAAELKELYTAVTRPQQRLWIVDDALFPAASDAEKHPILQYWEAGGLSDDFTLVNTAEEHSPDASFASLAHRSTPEEWARQGKYLFDHRHYAQAEHCYSRAGNSFRREQDISRAFSLQSEAARFAGREERAEAASRYREAAEQFCALNMPERAAGCYDEAGLNKEAGDLLRRHGKLEMAALQYLKCNAFSEQFTRRDACVQASGCLEAAGKPTEALEVLQGAKLWPDALQMLLTRGGTIDRELRARVAKLAYLHFENRPDCTVQADEALRLFGTDAERERFLLAHRCYSRLIDLYRATNRPEKAARILEREGAWLEAARDYRTAQLPRQAAENSVRGVSFRMRWRQDGRASLDGISQKDVDEALNLTIESCRREDLKVLGYKCRALKLMLAGDVKGLSECADYFKDKLGKCTMTTTAGALVAADVLAWGLRYAQKKERDARARVVTMHVRVFDCMHGDISLEISIVMRVQADFKTRGLVLCILVCVFLSVLSLIRGC
jgi:tetratricopeptide (TPR) repeat protein